MRKIYLLLMAMSLSLFAEGYETFVGAEYGKTKWKWDNGSYSPDEEKETVYGFRGGVKDDNTRIYVNVGYIDYDSPQGFEEKAWSANLNLDAMTSEYTLVGDVTTRFFAGFHGGMVDYEVENALTGDDATDVMYGAQLGLITEFHESIDLEIGYRYSMSGLSVHGFKLDATDAYYMALNVTF